MPAPPPLDYATWVGLQGFPPGEDEPLDDPDRDGDDNVLKFYAGTGPLDPTEGGTPVTQDSGTGPEVVYRRARNRAGVTCKLERSTTSAGGWDSYPDPGDVTTIDCGAFEKVVVALGSGSPPEFFRLAVTVTSTRASR